MPETKITDVKVPLPWERAVQHLEVAKEKAARQFLAIWRANKDREDLELRWGEEIEYTLVDLSGGGARAALRADEVLRRLGSETGGDDPAQGAGWRTEYGNMMVEGVTHPPFTWSLEEVLKLEPALAWRRRELSRVAAEVDPALRVVTLSAFPLLGATAAFTAPPAEPSPDGAVSQSVLCPDEATSPHPRYQTFTANYRKRKGCKVGAFIPREGIKPEERLPAERVAQLPFEVARRGLRERDPVPGYIYMDSQAFGACQCCTQVTVLAKNLEDARYLTDQFLVLAPLLLALTAATPFLRGLVADTDTRWPTFKQAWDDRTEEELTLVRNSRTSANDLFIGAHLATDDPFCLSANDVEVPVHGLTEKRLLAGGVDPLLSRHVAHVVCRDPLMVFEDRIDIDDEKEADHWEQLQGTNWGSVRFKPPPCTGDIGWRVEFRTPEVQITDFENAAIAAIIRVLAEVILEERWDLVIPVSLCDQNDDLSAERNAASQGLFWFRDSIERHAQLAAEGGCAEASPAKRRRSAAAGVAKRPLSEILAGPTGLFPKLRAWVAKQQGERRCSPEAAAKLESYMRLFERRASGELPTPAAFLRARLKRHPDYRGDGVLPVSFVHELCQLAASSANATPGCATVGELEALLGL